MPLHPVTAKTNLKAVQVTLRRPYRPEVYAMAHGSKDTTEAVSSGLPMPQPGTWELQSGRAASLLDSTTTTLREEWNRERRVRRCHQRVRSGTKLPGHWQMWTLTTSDEALSAGKDIQASFRALVMRLRRRGLCSGYLRVVEYTKRGSPHLHVLIRGMPIPHSWLSETWGQIHMSPVVWFSKVRHGAGAAAYLGKYLGKDQRARIAASWDWVWKGAVMDWRATCRWGFRRGYDLARVVWLWEGVLMYYADKPARDGPHLRGI